MLAQVPQTFENAGIFCHSDSEGRWFESSRAYFPQCLVLQGVAGFFCWVIKTVCVEGIHGTRTGAEMRFGKVGGGRAGIEAILQVQRGGNVYVKI